MPFLPHWSDLTDIFILFSGLIISTIVTVWVAASSDIRVRLISMGLLGAYFGFLMSENLSGDFNIIVALLLTLLFSFLYLVIGYSKFTSMRIIVMGLSGLLLGVIVAKYFTSGYFIRGFALDRIWHLILPVLCLSYGSFAALSKLMRTSVLENLLSDFARTARAKGLAEKDVIWRHVFRNSLLPLITISASLLPALLAGSVIVEAIFSIDGMGKLAVQAVQGRDREMVLSVTLVSGVLTLIGYLLADICYAIVDPRVSYD